MDSHRVTRSPAVSTENKMQGGSFCPFRPRVPNTSRAWHVTDTPPSAGMDVSQIWLSPSVLTASDFLGAGSS